VASATRTPTSAAGTATATASGTAPAAPTPRTYTIQPGDVPSLVAERNGISLSQLQAANPNVDFANGFFPGTVLTIPASTP
jgi:LysM repeat protein